MDNYKRSFNSTEVIASGTNQVLTSLSISSPISGVVASIELFVIALSQGKTSTLYYRGSEYVDITLTPATGNTSSTASAAYSESTIDCSHSLQYSYEQSSSRINILISNSTGKNDDVAYQIYYIVNYI